jgi:4-amino-4-deoxy-L-arabinose transferase-like glycosyltransferase
MADERIAVRQEERLLRLTTWFGTIVLLVHAIMLGWIAAKNSPSPDELGHLACGIATWETGDFGPYSVNPPLVRCVAAIPVLFCRPQTEPIVDSPTSFDAAMRPEWNLGLEFLRANRDQAMFYFTLARWSCIPFALIGGYFVWRWARELYGHTAGLIALVLWCMEPNILTWGATMCPDLTATSLGLVAHYCFWRWLKKPGALETLVAGLLLGLTLLTKMTWIILYGLWPTMWLLWRIRCGVVGVSIRTQAVQLGGLLLIGTGILNLGYLYEGPFTRLGDFIFVSRTLAGHESVVEGGMGGNRFAKTWLNRLPVPLPRDYVRGIDLQKVDFEQGLPSYLFGEWRNEGWWYFYLVCAGLKVPLGTWILGFLAIVITVVPIICSHRGSTTPKPRIFYQHLDPDSYGSSRSEGRLRNELFLLAPAIIIFVFVSSQTGFSRHFRYVLPAFPFILIWVSKVGILITRETPKMASVILLALIWTVGSSLSIFPHSMSYFNELAGGPRNGHKYLLDSNLDWGQDLFYLRDWCLEHPEAQPLHVLFRMPADEYLFRIEYLSLETSSFDVRSPGDDMIPRDLSALTPGWYAVSVERIYSPDSRYRCFSQLRPVAMAGYSIHIYHVEANAVTSTRQE